MKTKRRRRRRRKYKRGGVTPKSPITFHGTPEQAKAWNNSVEKAIATEPRTANANNNTTQKRPWYKRLIPKVWSGGRSRKRRTRRRRRKKRCACSKRCCACCCCRPRKSQKCRCRKCPKTCCRCCRCKRKHKFSKKRRK